MVEYPIPMAKLGPVHWEEYVGFSLQPCRLTMDNFSRLISLVYNVNNKAAPSSLFW